jgi:hypothetical protein
MWANNQPTFRKNEKQGIDTLLFLLSSVERGNAQLRGSNTAKTLSHV